MSNTQITSVVAGGGREALDARRKCIVIFGVAGIVVVAIVASKALARSPVNAFMWVRSVILLVIAPVLYRFAVSVSNGSHSTGSGSYPSCCRSRSWWWT